MNTQIQTLTEAKINELKFSEQAAVYNEFASAVGIKQVKKFRDKSTGISRIIQVQEQYVEEREELLAEKKAKAVEKVAKVKAEVTTEFKSRFSMEDVIVWNKTEGHKEGSIEASLCNAINNGCDTVGKIVEEVITTHKRPRSGQPVDKQYVIHNIRWFIKKGSLSLIEE